LDHIPLVITHEDNTELMKIIDEYEIINVIWGLFCDKSPCSNGFTIHSTKPSII
jgi:hypothetical protein